MKSRFYLLLTFMSMCCVGYAQEKTKTVDVSFGAISLMSGHSRIRLLGGADDLVLKNRYFTKYQSVELAEGKPLYIYGSGQTVVPGETKDIGRVNIPLTSKKGVVILLPKDGKYTGLFIDESKFPKGGVFLINHTQYELGFDIGDKKIRIASNDQHTYSVNKTEPVDVAVKIFTSSDEKKWKRFYTSKWRVTPSRREVILFYQKKKDGPVHTKGISQFVRDRPSPD